MTMTEYDLEYVRQFARRRAAIVLDKDKDYLIQSRLEKLAQLSGHASLSALVEALRDSPQAGRLTTQVIDALTTNETLFFRDEHPFYALRDHILPELIVRNACFRRLRIWSAACSTGQEPSSIAMLLRESFPELRGWDVSILATDLSSHALNQARSGAYTSHEVSRGLPAEMLKRHFRRTGERWVLSDDVRSLIQYRQLNLIEEWPDIGKFDLIFIRNVMIYFHPEARQRVLQKVSASVERGGYIVLGSSEIGSSILPSLKTVRHGPALFFQNG